MAQPRVSVADRRQQQWCAVSILDVGRMHDGTDEQSNGIGDEMAFATFDHLFGRITARPTRLGGLDRLAVDQAGRRAVLSALAFTVEHLRYVVDRGPGRPIEPVIELPLSRAIWWKILRQPPPLAAR